VTDTPAPYPAHRPPAPSSAPGPPAPDSGAGGVRRRRGRPPAGVREAILAATLDLAAEQGLTRLTAKEVARRAGASEASVFYHFGDKVGLLQAAMVAGLEPLMELDPAVVAGAAEGTVSETLLTIATSLEHFFDRVLPVLGAIQGDSELRSAFTDRMAARDLGPHRGVELLSHSLAGLQGRGLVDPDADVEAVAAAIIGACLLRSWQRYLFGDRRSETIPGLPRTIDAIAALLQAPDG
jgi:AcrR family transcriptional regulator